MARAITQSPLAAPSHGEEVPPAVTPARVVGPETEPRGGALALEPSGGGNDPTTPSDTAFD
eukprot:3638084-Alexandrium_andersonii.AAC.1